MIDSHCHLDHKPLVDNLNQVIVRSKSIGLDKILTISTTTSSFAKILDIINFDPMIYGTFGIHPHETNLELVKKETIIQNVISNKKIIGVGETGLDFYYNNSNKINQIKSFENHIKASAALNVPVIVHSRNAESETFEILDNYRKENLKILMHCFTGTSDFAKKLMKFNTYFSASGIITFKNSIDLQKTFEMIPEEKLLIETDSPFLSPEPMRGKKNEPSYIKFTLEKLAKLKNLNIKNLDNITTDNFNRLFF